MNERDDSQQFDLQAAFNEIQRRLEALEAPSTAPNLPIDTSSLEQLFLHWIMIFFRTILDDETRRSFLYECPRNTARQYQPPPLNNINTSVNTQRIDRQLRDIQYRLSGITRPIDLFVHDTVRTNSVDVPTATRFANTIHTFLANITSVISQVRSDNVCRDAGLATIPISPFNQINAPLLDAPCVLEQTHMAQSLRRASRRHRPARRQSSGTQAKTNKQISAESSHSRSHHTDDYSGQRRQKFQSGFQIRNKKTVRKRHHNNHLGDENPKSIVTNTRTNNNSTDISSSNRLIHPLSFTTKRYQKNIRSRFSFHNIHNSQEGWRLTTLPQPSTIESFYHQQTFQNGNNETSLSPDSTGRLAYQHRSAGCIPSHQYSQNPPQIPSISLGEPDLRFSHPRLWPISIANGFYQGLTTSHSLASKEQSHYYTQLVMSKLSSLGFLIKEAKSHTTPSPQIDHLEFKINTNTMCLKVPSCKIRNLRREARKLTNNHSTTVRHLSSFIGKAQAMSLAVLPARLFT
ncbi:hypothetical protein INT45_001697 [Circinella minor]|uniref:Uncharacterized protein n=1 Tax=Circinella minor TaxID=1195481 RepID=A0A8H7VGT3_9FUNG|nr:hypothetical protein INT45_001697 [Circinella minor]